MRDGPITEMNHPLTLSIFVEKFHNRMRSRLMTNGHAHLVNYSGQLRGYRGRANFSFRILCV